MSYTNRLKVCVIADVLFLLTLLITGILYVSKMINYDVLWVCATGAVVILFLAWGFRDYGKYKFWRNIWKDPIWMKASSIVIAVAVLLIYFKNLETEKMSVAMMILVSIAQTISDIKYYNRAVKYDMNNIEDVNELARKFPEARPYINRKEKRVNKEGDKVS